MIKRISIRNIKVLKAIANQLSQLGVNPAVALSGGHGVGAAPAAMPSGISSPALSAPSLENEGTALLSLFRLSALLCLLLLSQVLLMSRVRKLLLL